MQVKHLRVEKSRRVKNRGKHVCGELLPYSSILPSIVTNEGLLLKIGFKKEGGKKHLPQNSGSKSFTPNVFDSSYWLQHVHFTSVRIYSCSQFIHEFCLQCLVLHALQIPYIIRIQYQTKCYKKTACQQNKTNF